MINREMEYEQMPLIIEQEENNMFMMLKDFWEFAEYNNCYILRL